MTRGVGRPRKIPDLAGSRFGRLVVLEELPVERRKTRTGKLRYQYYLLCECDCGNIVRVQKEAVLKGMTKSCGCIRSERGKAIIDAVRSTQSYTRGGVYPRPNGYWAVILHKKYYGRYKSEEEAKSVRDRIVESEMVKPQ